MPDLALRWILAEPAVSTVISGMRKISHVDANLGVSDGRSLDASLLVQLKAHRWDRTRLVGPSETPPERTVSYSGVVQESRCELDPWCACR